MDYYDQMYNGNLQCPGWETSEKHKNALNINIPSLPHYPTPELPPHLKNKFERLLERRPSKPFKVNIFGFTKSTVNSNIIVRSET